MEIRKLKMKHKETSQKRRMALMAHEKVIRLIKIDIFVIKSALLWNVRREWTMPSGAAIIIPTVVLQGSYAAEGCGSIDVVRQLFSAPRHVGRCQR